MSQVHGATDVYIFSTQRPDKAERKNLEAYLDAFCTLKRAGIMFKEGRGSWEGQEEPCFVITCEAWPNGGGRESHIINTLCDKYSQDCFLYCSPHRHGLRKAFLVYPDGSRTFTGYLRGVGEKVARTFARWTNCGEGWWIVHPSDATQIGAWDTILAEERAAAA